MSKPYRRYPPYPPPHRNVTRLILVAAAVLIGALAKHGIGG